MVGGSLSLNTSLPLKHVLLMIQTMCFCLIPVPSSSAMNTLKMLLRRSSFSSSLHIDRIIVQQQIPDQINFKMFFECLMYMELGAVGVGVRWKPSLYTRGYCVLVPYFVFRASWVSWTMKRKCLLS